MPKLYGNTTVLQQNRNAIRFGVGPIHRFGRLHAVDTGPKQHIVAPLRSVPTIYDPAAIPKPILAVITPRPQPARSSASPKSLPKWLTRLFVAQRTGIAMSRSLNAGSSDRWR